MNRRKVGQILNPHVLNPSMPGYAHLCAAWTVPLTTTGLVLSQEPARRYQSRAVGAGMSLVPLGGSNPSGGNIGSGLASLESTSASTGWVRVRDTSDAEAHVWGTKTELTIMGWVKTATGTGAILGSGRATTNSAAQMFGWVSSVPYMQLYNGTGFFTLSGTRQVPTANATWVHLAYSQHATTGKKMYWNGIEDATSSDTASQLDVGCEMLGSVPNSSDSSGVSGLVGSMFGVLVFDRKLEQGEIQSYYRWPLLFLAHPFRQSGSRIFVAGSNARSFFPGFI